MRHCAAVVRQQQASGFQVELWAGPLRGRTCNPLRITEAVLVAPPAPLEQLQAPVEARQLRVLVDDHTQAGQRRHQGAPSPATAASQGPSPGRMLPRERARRGDAGSSQTRGGYLRVHIRAFWQETRPRAVCPRSDSGLCCGTGMCGKDTVQDLFSLSAHTKNDAADLPVALSPCSSTQRPVQATSSGHARDLLLDRSAGSKTDPIEMTVIDRAPVRSI
eukprot:COSAG01_NODE_796_length_13536_cov_5.683635_12_plen_219_part_00